MRKFEFSQMQAANGTATIEYVLVALLVVIVLIASPSVIGDLIAAIKQLYQAFSNAIGDTYAVPDDPLTLLPGDYLTCILRKGF